MDWLVLLGNFKALLGGCICVELGTALVKKEKRSANRRLGQRRVEDWQGVREKGITR